MVRLETRFFGELDCEQNAFITFPSGLPAFERYHRFVLIKRPGVEPVMFLQSVEAGSLCFILVPVPAVDRNFHLDLSEADAAEIGLPAGRKPEIGVDILCAAIVSAPDAEEPTVNLLAPVVVNLHNNRGVQAIQRGGSYSHRHRLLLNEASVSCS